MLLGYYLVPAGSVYLLFYVLKRDQWRAMKIQDRYPDGKNIRREIKWSVISVLIVSMITTGLILLIQAGKTKMYFDVSERGWFYLIGSAVVFILAYDTYFYWLHRFMHLKKVFPLVHRLHHTSHTPSPWAILAFHPLEAILEFMIYPMVIFLIPLHPYAVGFFVFHNIVLNTLGHAGYEVVPRSFFRNPILGIGLTVTHHDMHHSKVRCNYGIYFNIWDRIMGTNHPDYESTYLHIKDKSEPA